MILLPEGYEECSYEDATHALLNNQCMVVDKIESYPKSCYLKLSESSNPITTMLDGSHLQALGVIFMRKKILRLTFDMICTSKNNPLGLGSEWFEKCIIIEVREKQWS